MPTTPNNYFPSIPDNLDPRTRELIRQMMDRIVYLLEMERLRNGGAAGEIDPTRWAMTTASDAAMSGGVMPGYRLPPDSR